MPASSSTTIQTLRLRTAPTGQGASQQVALRLRTSAWLGMADLRPPGLPPAAILHVRRLPDPLPNRANPSSSFRPPPAWQQALRSAMSEALRAAKQPANGRVPASAAAVVFANPAEQMACLAVDLAHGRASQCWWWTPLLNRVRSGAAAPGAQIARALTDSPADTPTAIAYLATWSELSAVLPALSAPEAEAVLRTWAPHHGLTLPAEALSHIQQEQRRASKWGTRDTQAAAPWSQATERLIPSGWSRAHRALAGLALEQVRAPHRTDSRARTTAIWWTLLQPTNRSSDAADGQTLAPARHELLHNDLRERKQPGAAETLSPLTEQTARGPVRATEIDNAAPKEPSNVTSEARPDQSTKPPKIVAVRSVDADSNGMTAPDGSPRYSDPKSSVNDIAKPTDPSARSSGDVKQADADAIANPTGPLSARSVSPEKGRESSAHDSTSDDERAGATDGPPSTSPEASRSGSDNHSGNASTESARSAPPLPDSPVSTTNVSETGVPNLDTQVFGSHLGGAIYLVNLLDALNLTGWVEEESPFATRVQGEASPWAVLEAVTRALLTGVQGDAFPSDVSPADPFPADPFPADPWKDDLWTALAHLDGRSPDTPAGANLIDMRAYVAPAAALAEVEPPNVELRWQVRDGRLRVGSHQCLWAERPAPEHPKNSAEALLEHVHGETGAFPGATLRRVPPSDPAGSSFPDLPDAALPHVSPVLRQWTRCVLPLVTTRLRQALGESLDPSSSGDLASLLAIPATLHIEPMHLDVMLPLDAISLPVRMAGLDRSPGWIPSFGKVIQVHFE